MTILKMCVLLPGKNEATVIADTLKSVLDANMPAADIYVVDDGSTDETGAIARSFDVNVLTNEVNIGKASSIVKANNTWSLDRRYDIICLMDADSLVDRDYYTKIEKEFHKYRVAVVSANTKSIPHNWLTAYRCFIYFMSNLIYKQGQSSMGVISVVPGFAASYSANAFRQLTWDTDTVVEDMDTTIQVHKKRLGKIVYAPAATAYTQDPNTLRDYIKQIYRWHSGAWQVGIKHKMFSGLSPIDLEFKFLMVESLIFAVAYLLFPLWLLIWPKLASEVLLVEIGIFALISLIVSIITKRWDVIRYMPTFLFLRVVDCGVLVYSFWRTVMLGKHDTNWNAVKRYTTTAKEKQCVS